jgi:hypothetical protein
MLPPDVEILFLNDYYRKDKLCLCSSNKNNKKFEDCCFHKNLTFREFYYDYLINTKKLDELSDMCAYNLSKPNTCHNKPIYSHSISKSKYLKEISNENIVLSFKAKRMKKEGHIYQLSETSINNASTFKGCCLTHDKNYEKIDLNFDPFNYSDYLLLSHRQYLYELHLHVMQEFKMERFLFSCAVRGNLLNYFLLNRNRNNSIYKDYRYYLMKYELEINNNKKYAKRDFSCYCLKFDKFVPFSFSTIYSPLTTLDGKKLQESSLIELDNSIYYSLFTINGISYLIFMSLRNDFKSKKFIREIIDDKNNISKNLLKLSIMTQNTYYNKNFVTNNDLKDLLQYLYGEDLMFYLKNDYTSRCLLLEENLYNYDEDLTYKIIYPVK